MDFKKLISKIESIDGPIDTPKAPSKAEAIRLDEDTELRVLAGVTALTESVIAEKSVSKSQQKAAGAALAAKRGDTPKSKLTGASKEMMSMSTKELEKFAGTKHKGLPEKKKTDESIEEAKIEKSGVRASDKKKGKVEKSTKKQYFVKLDKDGSTKGVTMTADEGESQSEVKDRAARDYRSQGYKVVSIREKGDVSESFYDKFDKMVEAKKTEKKDDKKKPMKEAAKPDFLDVDKDGDKKEPMKKASKEAEKGGEKKETTDLSAKQKKLPAGLQKAIAKKKTVKESVEQKLSLKDMLRIVKESGGQQQIDPVDQTLWSWASRVAAAKINESSKAEIFAAMIYERNGGRFEMYDVLSENQK